MTFSSSPIVPQTKIGKKLMWFVISLNIYLISCYLNIASVDEIQKCGQPNEIQWSVRFSGTVYFAVLARNITFCVQIQSLSFRGELIFVIEVFSSGNFRKYLACKRVAKQHCLSKHRPNNIACLNIVGYKSFV